MVSRRRFLKASASVGAGLLLFEGKDASGRLQTMLGIVDPKRPGEYVYHCHILSHEDHEMMRPFRVGP